MFSIKKELIETLILNAYFLPFNDLEACQFENITLKVPTPIVLSRKLFLLMRWYDELYVLSSL